MTNDKKLIKQVDDLLDQGADFHDAAAEVAKKNDIKIEEVEEVYDAQYP